MIFNLEKILQPTESSPPCGPYLFYEPVYDIIQQERKEDDATLPQGVWERDLKKADWQKVLALCIKTLEEESKDIQIAVWAAESAAMIYGPQGLRDGMILLRKLSQTFWDDIHPVFREEDPEYRFAPLDWCDAAFTRCLLQTPISQPHSFQEKSCIWADWVDAEHYEKLQKQLKNKPVNKPKMTVANVVEAIDATPTGFYLELGECFQNLQEEVGAFLSFLEEKNAALAPTFSAFRRQIDEMHYTAKKWLKERKGVDLEAIPPAEQGEASMTASGTAAIQIPSGDGLQNRDKAYMLLTEAAEILKRCEPHSPVPYVIRRLISWKDKSLDELMVELSKRGLDLSVLQKLFQEVS